MHTESQALLVRLIIGLLRVTWICWRSYPEEAVGRPKHTSQRSHNLGKRAQMLLPDGRWLVTWETRRPRLYENYVLQWQW